MGQNPFSDSQTAQPMSEINTTPLVDVMLVLLVIFIITAPLLTHAVKIDLPQASSQAIEDKPEIVDVAIDAEGLVYWNDIQVAEGALEENLQRISQQPKQAEIQIRADKNTRYEVIAKLMAVAQTNGVSKIGFVSQPN